MEMMKESAHMKIVIKNLSKTFSSGVTAINNLNLEIETGIFGLLGKNGAGKSTLMRCLTTLLVPTNGTINILGIDVVPENYEEIKKIIGYLPQELGLYPNMTVEDSLDYMGILSGLDKETRKTRIDHLLDLTNLKSHAKKKNKQLSGGMKRRVGLVQAMLNMPKVLIVDEPTAGLDPEERINIRNLLTQLSKDRIVILSTHVVEDIAATCKKICIMDSGDAIYSGTVDELFAKVDGHTFDAVVRDEEELKKIKEKYVVATQRYVHNGIQVHFIADEIPESKCVSSEANMEDAYIYVTHNRR